MRKLSIAVIDDGIQTIVLESLVGHYTDINSLQILDGSCVEQYTQPLAIINHGTVCTALLIEYLEKYELLNLVDITSLSIANLENDQTLTALFDALNWCADHQVDLVLMSLGAKSYIYAKKLLPVIEHAKLHLTMVAAAANDDSITYPACFRSVIGVKSIPYSDKTSDILNVILSPCDGVEIEAWISDSNVFNRCKEIYSIEYAKSNSIMVPFVASHLCRILLENGHKSKNGLLEILSSRHRVKTGELINPSLSGDLPIVLALYRTDSGWNIFEILTSLVQLFMDNTYSCACLTDYCSESIFEKSIYCLPSMNGHLWVEYYRKALAFNSFILIAINEDNHLIGDIEADLILSSKNMNANNAREFTEEIYNMVIINMAFSEEVEQ